MTRRMAGIGRIGGMLRMAMKGYKDGKDSRNGNYGRNDWNDDRDSKVGKDGWGSTRETMRSHLTIISVII